MKLLVVGATYMDNFGDLLFARLILEKLSGKADSRFYLTSEECRKFVGAENLSDFAPKEADALLYMPGGYLGDRSDTSLRTTYLWFKRYFPIGLYFARKKKPILILAVDAGPCKYWFMRKVIAKICKSAALVVVRNEESQQFLVDKIKISSDSIVVTSDYAQTLRSYPIPEYSGIEQWKARGRKLILLHINECMPARNVIIPALERFCAAHKDAYEIIVASDQHYSNDGETFEAAKRVLGDCVHYYRYDDPFELCSVIKGCDCVVTYKLHVGIVASAYSKSVIPIPEHYKKVRKYYNQIGHGNRVLPLKDATADLVFERLEEYVNKPIVLAEDIYEKAMQNNSYIDKFIEQIKSGAKHG